MCAGNNFSTLCCERRSFKGSNIWLQISRQKNTLNYSQYSNKQNTLQRFNELTKVEIKHNSETCLVKYKTKSMLYKIHLPFTSGPSTTVATSSCDGCLLLPGNAGWYDNVNQGRPFFSVTLKSYLHRRR